MALLDYLAKIQFESYKSFSEKGPFNLSMDQNITLIIGRNNCGKSSLIDVIENTIEYDTKSADHVSSPSSRYYKTTFPDTMKSLYPTYHIPTELLKSPFAFEPQPYTTYHFSNTDLTIMLDEHHINVADKQTSINKDELSTSQIAYKLQCLLQNVCWRRINAERDIIPEVEYDQQTVDENGNGATNLIRMYINSDKFDESVVEKTILTELNRIMEPDAHFDSIRVQQIGERTDKGYQWEVFLEEKGHRYAMSKSGSGLKTILLILVNLYLIPSLDKNKKEFCYAFEEIENNLHPALQKRVFDYLYDYSMQNNVKIFITSHSHIAINTLYGKEKTKIYHVIKENGQSNLTEIASDSTKGNILDEIGVKASDIFQSNGIIWVEGPSDRVYILKWLEVFTDFKYVEGLHFQFMYYGGRLLSHYEAAEQKEKNDGLINILTTNRHAAIVIDSDRRVKGAHLNDTKKRIEKEFADRKLFCWITKGKEIENYVSIDAVRQVYNSQLDPIDQYGVFPEYIEQYDKHFSSHKVDAAKNMCMHITKDNSEDILDLKEQITKLYDAIQSWN